MNRLSLYVFYEKNGDLRNSDRYYLKGLKEVSDVAVLVNGKISASGSEFLRNEGYDVFCRENSGFDFAAWKEYLEAHFAEITERYDEIILCNCSCYGPVVSLKGVFSKMDGAKCDFWGLYRHPGIPGVFPPHLQSYFLVLRSRLLKDKSFADYLRDLVPARSWNEAVGQETHFTKYFEDRGFVSSSFIDDSLSGIYPDATIILPERLLELGFPFVKRKVFSVDYKLIQSFTDGTYIRSVIDFLKTRTDYPLELIKEDAVRSMTNSQLRNIFHLTYALNSDGSHAGSPDGTQPKSATAAILYSYFDDLIEQDLGYLASLPANCHLYIVVVSEKMKKLWDDRLRKSGFRYEIRIQENRGRNEAAYWLTCRDVIESFDYICLIHEKKTKTAHPPVKGLCWSRHCWNSVLFSKEYVLNIIRLFDSRPDLGILMPTAPVFAEWPDLIFNREWATDRDVALKVYGMLRLTVPFDEHPAAPWGAIFWVRGRAMKALYRYSWTVNDLPEEPIKVADGTVLHALERMYPMIAQESGFLSGWVVPSVLMGTYYDNLYFKAVEYKAQRDGLKAKCAELSNAVKSLQEALDARKQPEAVCDSKITVEEESLWQPGPMAILKYRLKRHVLRQRLRKERKHFTEFFSRKTDLWDSEYYLKKYPDVAASWDSALEHYVRNGWKERRNPSEKCSTEDYLRVNPDCALLKLSPLEHYYLCHRIGRAVFWSYEDMRRYAAEYGLEILKKSALFNPEYYRKSYERKFGSMPENFEPYSYYLEHGANDLVKPSPHFRVHRYSDMFPYLKIYGICPVVHYELLGRYL